jgi:hypothetical protein
MNKYRGRERNIKIIYNNDGFLDGCLLKIERIVIADPYLCDYLHYDSYD